MGREGKLLDDYMEDAVRKTAGLMCDYNNRGYVLVWEFKSVKWPYIYSERINQEPAKAALEQKVASQSTC